MANLIRSAKSSSDWTLNELDSYNIHLERREALESFWSSDPAVDPELFQYLEADDMQQARNAELINLLDLAMLRSSGESAVDDFVVELLRHTGYVHRNRVACTRKDLPLLICGEWRHAKTDVCIVDRRQNDILLLVQEDKYLEDREPLDAHAQLVVEALAAFAESNAGRESFDLPPFESKASIPIPLTVSIMPGIVMAGTAPTFPKIPVTQELMNHVRYGMYPPTPTVVTYCFPPLPHPLRRRSDGMKPFNNRSQILSCYEAFKTVVGI
ncbi:hypothetical protein CVT25_012794 [Psilocybe cyanescens]|uniref:Uncharacterized protein n=1 Tax=Psilocybe cyanescens TaxID=93625 RepID=A0A409XLG5_PSICY|nr:hypothetical protein CVT25_012794 [Psilocybe cyanescens]